MNGIANRNRYTMLAEKDNGKHRYQKRNLQASTLAWNPAGEVAELVVAHIISTSYPRRSEALGETPESQ